jgi:hypothetical protein
MEQNDDNTKIVFHKDTEILLKDGTFKKAIDIEENDILLGGIGPYENIVKKKYFSKENLYRIISRYGNSFILGENTDFLVFDNKNAIFDHIDAKQYTLMNNNKNSLSIHKTAVEYHAIDLEVDPYFIGVFLGNMNKLFVKIKHDNNPILIFTMHETIDALKLKIFSSPDEYIMFISDIHLEDDIKMEYDFLFGSLKYIPDVYKKNSIEVRRKLLTGIIDINSVQKSNYIEIRNLNKILALDIYNLLFSIGIFHVLLVKEKQYFNIQIFGDTKHIQFSKNYETKPHICNNFKVASIIEKECVVIEVENGANVILSDFTVI